MLGDTVIESFQCLFKPDPFSHYIVPTIALRQMLNAYDRKTPKNKQQLTYLGMELGTVGL